MNFCCATGNCRFCGRRDVLELRRALLGNTVWPATKQNTVVDELHVVPAGGREHDSARTCWCKPVPSPGIRRGTVWVHSYREVA